MTARTRWIALVAGLAAVAACAGCSVRSSTAFSVDGTVVTQSQVDQVAQSCQKAYNQGNPSPATFIDMRAQSVQWQLDGVIGVALSKKLGISFTTDDRTQFLNQTRDGPALIRDPLCQQTLLDFATMVLVANQVGPQFMSDVSQLDIAVNPRYGVFDPTQIALTGSGSLSVLDENH